MKDILRVTTLLPHSLRVDGGLHVDRLQVTWSVRSGGNIREMRG